MFATVALWLFVLDLGAVFGAGLYEARISLPRWSNGGWHPEEARRDDVGRRFWGFVSTLPLTLLTLANLWLAWQSAEALRPWWLAAAGAALVERVLTFGYFIPRMVKLMRSEDSESARQQMSQWAALNWARLALVAVAWLAAMQVFAHHRSG